MIDHGAGVVRHPSIHERKSTTAAFSIICLFSRCTWSPYEIISTSDLGFTFYGQDAQSKKGHDNISHIKSEKLTSFAVVSFKPIRTLARVCVISSYCTCSCILAWVVGARIHCKMKKKEHRQIYFVTLIHK